MISFAIRYSIWKSICFGTVLVLLLMVSMLGGEPLIGEQNNPVEAKILRSIEHKALPDHSLVIVQLTNIAPFPKEYDFMNTGFKNKVGDESFEPIWIRWFQNGKLVAEDVSALQQSFNLGAGKSKELSLLIKRPQNGDYILEIMLIPLEGTANSAVPGKFTVRAHVEVKQRLLHLHSEERK
jgi:hypothetical protein